MSRYIEAVRNSPARYAVPLGMTAYRVPAAIMTVVEARRDNWSAVGKWIATGAISDKESWPADLLNARSKAGAKADPIADGVLRAGGVIAFAPHMSKVALGITVAAEVDTVRMNSTIQRGQDHPVVPKGAKAGTLFEGAGAISFIEGMKKNNASLRTAGQLLIVAGAATRWATYRRIYQRTEK